MENGNSGDPERRAKGNMPALVTPPALFGGESSCVCEKSVLKKGSKRSLWYIELRWLLIGVCSLSVAESDDIKSGEGEGWGGLSELSYRCDIGNEKSSGIDVDCRSDSDSISSTSCICGVGLIAKLEKHDSGVAANNDEGVGREVVDVDGDGLDSRAEEDVGAGAVGKLGETLLVDACALFLLFGKNTHSFPRDVHFEQGNLLSHLILESLQG